MNNYYYYNYKNLNIDEHLPSDLITVSVRAFSDSGCRKKILEMKEVGCKVFTYLPNFWETSDGENLRELKEAAEIVDGIYVNNIGQIRLAAETGLPVFGDAGLNIFNTETALYFAEQGLKSVTLSYELREEAEGLVKQINQKISERLLPEINNHRAKDGKKERVFKTEVLWKGRVPAMYSRYCPLAGALGIMKADCGSCERAGSVFLKDSRGESYPVITDRKNCTSLILSKEELKNKPCGDIRRITI